MKHFTARAVSDQFTDYLREAIMSGEMSGSMPGIKLLAEKLGVSPSTVIAAVARLESEGFLMPQGPGRASRIVLPEGLKPQALRVAILLYEKSDATRDYLVELRHAL